MTTIRKELQEKYGTMCIGPYLTPEESANLYLVELEEAVRSICAEYRDMAVSIGQAGRGYAELCEITDRLYNLTIK